MATETIFTILSAGSCCGAFKPRLLTRKEDFHIPAPRAVLLTVELRCASCDQKQTLSQRLDGGKDYYKRVRPLLDRAAKEAETAGGV